jgi:hypothetical protein
MSTWLARFWRRASTLLEQLSIPSGTVMPSTALIAVWSAQWGILRGGLEALLCGSRKQGGQLLNQSRGSLWEQLSLRSKTWKGTGKRLAALCLGRPTFGGSSWKAIPTRTTMTGQSSTMTENLGSISLATPRTVSSSKHQAPLSRCLRPANNPRLQAPPQPKLTLRQAQ